MTEPEKLIWAAAFAVELSRRPERDCSQPEAASNAQWSAFSAVQAFRSYKPPRGSGDEDATMFRSFKRSR